MPRAGWVKPTDDQRLSDHVALGVLSEDLPACARRRGGRGDPAGPSDRSPTWRARSSTTCSVYALFAARATREIHSLVEDLSWKNSWSRRSTVASRRRSPAGLGSARAPRRAVQARLCVPRHRCQFLARSSPRVDGRHRPRRARPTPRRRRLRSPGSARGKARRSPSFGSWRWPVRDARHVRGGDQPPMEQRLARLASSCAKGMLVLADRGFGGSYALFSAFARAAPTCAGGPRRRHAARARAPRRRFVPFRARRGDGSAGPGARDPGPGDRVADRRTRDVRAPPRSPTGS